MTALRCYLVPCGLAVMCWKALVIPASYHSVKSQSWGIHTHSSANGSMLAASGSSMKAGVALGGIDGNPLHGLKVISRGTAVLLFFVYLAYLYFQVGALVAVIKCWASLIDRGCVRTSSSSRTRSCMSPCPSTGTKRQVPK